MPKMNDISSSRTQLMRNGTNSEWARYKPSLQEKAGKHEIKPEAGVYVVLANAEIRKIKKSDPLGLLYIGQSSNLSRRLDFRRRSDAFRAKYGLSRNQSRSSNSFDHSCLTFCLDFDDSTNQLKFDSSLTQDGSLLAKAKPVVLVRYDGDPRGLEGNLLLDHFEEYGCMPPFNSTGMSMKSFFRHGEREASILKELKTLYTSVPSTLSEL